MCVKQESLSIAQIELHPSFALQWLYEYTPYDTRSSDISSLKLMRDHKPIDDSDARLISNQLRLHPWEQGGHSTVDAATSGGMRGPPRVTSRTDHRCQGVPGASDGEP